MTDADSAVPPRLDEDAISKLELTEVADLIRTRQLTSAEVTESTLRRIERLDPQLKSYAFVMPETALAAARAADADIARGHYEGVLHGVPIGVKDLCYTVDAPTAAGTTIFRDFRPAYDATVVARLRAAGAVIIGKLAMTEGAYLGYHPSLPTPVNPWDPTAWAGVSSSGCGVATAAGLCFGSIGSDTGGSIRFPTSMCGVTGIKPTWGRVSRHGVVELAASYDHVGPITRSAHDAAVLLSVIAGSDIHDPSCSAEPVPDYAADLALTRIPRVGVDWSQTTSFDEDTTAMLADVVKTLDDIGRMARHRRQAARACADGGSVRKNARGRNGDRACRHLPGARRRVRADHARNDRRRTQAGCGGISDADRAASGIHAIAASRVPRRGHPADAQRRNCLAHTGNHARARTRPGADRQTGDADSTVQRQR